MGFTRQTILCFLLDWFKVFKLVDKTATRLDYGAGVDRLCQTVLAAKNPLSQFVSNLVFSWLVTKKLVISPHSVLKEEFVHYASI